MKISLMIVVVATIFGLSNLEAQFRNKTKRKGFVEQQDGVGKKPRNKKTKNIVDSKGIGDVTDAAGSDDNMRKRPREWKMACPDAKQACLQDFTWRQIQVVEDALNAWDLGARDLLMKISASDEKNISACQADLQFLRDSEKFIWHTFLSKPDDFYSPFRQGLQNKYRQVCELLKQASVALVQLKSKSTMPVAQERVSSSQEVALLFHQARMARQQRADNKEPEAMGDDDSAES